MLRSYRYVIVAAVGWLTLTGADKPKEQAKTTQAAGQGKQTEPTEAPYKPYSDYQSERCYRAENHNAADLCAQWRSVAAAEKATELARSGNLISGLSMLFSFFGVVLVVGALRQTEQSLKIARAANAISSDLLKRQLRAYLSIEPGGVNEAENDYYRVPIALHNNGATPAHKIMIFSRFAITTDPIDFDPSSIRDKASIAENSDASLGPNSQRWNYIYMAEDFAKPHVIEIAAKRAAIVHFGYVSYLDAFEDERKTHFAFYHWGGKLSDVAALRCRLGNYAT